MNGAKIEFCAKIRRIPKRMITRRIGISHHFLRTRMKAQRSAKMESLDTCAEGTKYDESIGLGLHLRHGLRRTGRAQPPPLGYGRQVGLEFMAIVKRVSCSISR